MTAKEKAKELFERFLLPITQRYIEQDQKIGKGEISVAKQCALICVQYLIADNDGNDQGKYWKEVKTKIQNL